MDEVKIRSALLRSIIEKIINKKIEKHLGHKIEIVFKDPIGIIFDNGQLIADINASVRIDEAEMHSILKDLL